MARRREGLQNPATQIDGSDVVCVARKAEEFPRGIFVGLDKNGVGTVGELFVSRDVVAVCMRVKDQQPVAVAGVATEPGLDESVDDPAERKEVRCCGRPGVEKYCALLSEQQKQERRLVVDRLVLPCGCVGCVLGSVAMVVWVWVGWGCGPGGEANATAGIGREEEGVDKHI